MVSETDYVELGLSCAGVCETLGQGMDKRGANKPSRSTIGAIEKLAT